MAFSSFVPETGALDQIVQDPITPNDLKPSECATVNLENLVAGSGVITGTNANDLVLGSAGPDNVNGLGGYDCILGGSSADLLRGGTSPPAMNVWDQFNTVSYSNNDGNQNWSNDWQEIGESDGPLSGDVNVEVSMGRGIYTLLVEQDTHIEQQFPNANFGLETRLKVKPQAGDQKRALLRFDLSAIPPGSNVVSATANFYVRLNHTQPVNIHRITGDWAEMGATWNNSADAFDPAIVASFSPANNLQFVSADITALVQQWVDGIYPNYGIMLIASPTAVETRYSSREATANMEDAHLQVDISQGGGAITTYANQDTHVDQIRPNNNFATDVQVRVKARTGDQKRGLLRFDLSSIPPQSSVLSATISFFVQASDTNPVNIHRITGDWTEIGATWNNSANAFDPAVAASFTPAFNHQFVSANITALLQQWVDGTYPNFGLMLIATSGTAESRYSSREANGISEDPFLTVVLAPSGSTQALRIRNTLQGAWRQADLTSAVYAWLSFDYLRIGLDDAADYVSLELSPDGGLSWSELDRFTGPANDSQMQAASYDISSFISSNTALRLLSSAALGTDERVYFDSIFITFSTTSPVGLDDILLGGAGDDELDGDAGIDTCYGGTENDTFWNCEAIFDP